MLYGIGTLLLTCQEWNRAVRNFHVATRWSRRDPIGRITADKKLEQIEPFVYQCGKAIAIVIPALIDGKSIL